MLSKAVVQHMNNELIPLDDSLKLFTDLSVGKDYLGAVRAILSYPLINFVGQYFGRTRDGEAQLHFVSLCRDVINSNIEKLTASEAEEYQKIFLYNELAAYDRLNEFHNYIALFDYVRVNLSYTQCYAKSRNDEAFNKYVLYEDERYKYVHFLYTCDSRYQVIKRKHKKQMDGSLPRTMLRHQQEELEPSELECRFEELRNLFFEMVNLQNRG